VILTDVRQLSCRHRRPFEAERWFLTNTGTTRECVFPPFLATPTIIRVEVSQRLVWQDRNVRIADLHVSQLSRAGTGVPGALL
jgi:hypothetical protein